jgi:transcriptional regulator with XRE-family HTH domain
VAIMALMEAINPPKVPEQSRKPGLPVPAPVSRAIVKLGEDLNRARRRRNLTQQEVAKRIGASLNTVKRLENGDLKIPLHFLARMLFLFGELDRLGTLLDSGQDDIGLTLMDDRLPQRVRPAKKRETAF